MAAPRKASAAAGPESPPPAGPATVGRLVHYRLSQADVDAIAAQRARLVTHAKTGRGTVAPIPLTGGNDPHVGDLLPLLVVRAWDDGSVNGQVVLDGNDVLWVTSRHAGDQPGTWCWPERT